MRLVIFALLASCSATPAKVDERSCRALITRRCGFDPGADNADPTPAQRKCYSRFADEYVYAEPKPCVLKQP